MIAIYLHSSHSCLQEQKHFNGLSSFFVCFDAELPEMSDPECKLHIMRPLSGFEVLSVTGGGLL